MTRPRSSAPGRVRPDRRRSLLPLVALATILVVGCTPTPPRATSTPDPGAAASEGASAAPSATPATAPSSSAAPPPSAEPPSQAPSAAPPSLEPTGAPSSSAAAGSADACAGNDDNKDFYAAVADAVDWPVYCPVLPSGWFVVEGQYRAAAGGRMEIVYRGPSGRRIELSEGSFCDDGSSCLPTGSDLGSAAFGDMAGTMVQTDDGYAIVVDGGDGPSWLLEGIGTSEQDLRDIGAALLRIS